MGKQRSVLAGRWSGTRDGWLLEAVDELRAHGKQVWANTLPICGLYSAVRDCKSCGVETAHAETGTTCRQRLCGFCARRAAAQQARMVRLALRSVREDLVSRVAAKRSELLVESQGLKDRRDRLDGQIAVWRECGKEAQVERAVVRRDRLEDRRVRVERIRRFIKARTDKWSVRMLTISPPWDPSDPRQLTVSGLRRRIDDCWARWERLVQAGVGLDGLLSASARLEISPGGHVHLHVVFLGPYFKKEWLAKQTGCFVDVREATSTDDAVTEAVKYAVKSPSPLSSGWVSGAVRSGLLHPRLAVRFQIALYQRKALRHYGPLREAMRSVKRVEKAKKEQERLQGEEHESIRKCRCCCSTDLSEPRIVLTADLARECGSTWALVYQSVLRRGPPCATTP